MNTSTFQEYLALFPTLNEAVSHENACLSVGDDFLPGFVIAVRDQEAVPSELYWKWLSSQVNYN